ncbi:DUF4352 domain-containing protein [Actinomadura rugatobispora]|uniref:DUF4352 domain-containing protein n=1 Tax=Actinomadura rugatobispora TaxID=1994 RepID=A0ABW0ZZ79_9ACTN|nr:hypothetical protein GCM10010200_012050 [Actinomadura rugatobispora]
MRTSITAVALGLTAVLTVTGCEIEGAEPTAVQPADKGAGSAKPKKKTTVKLAATPAKAKASVLSDGSALSCVRVTITNQRKGNLAVNPLYFSLVDGKGEKHESSDALGDYQGQVPTTTLAPGETAKGTVCAKGKFTPAIVAMTDELLQELARAEVA